MKKAKIGILLPCYNEEPVLWDSILRLRKQLGFEYTIICVDDGSTDGTWDVIKKASRTRNVLGLKLAHNRGQENALLAGLMFARDKFDAVISMDADLQDDMTAIPEMIKQYQAGNNVVYGVRKSRKKDGWFKRFTAKCFYKMMHILGVEMISEAANFRLMDKKALNALAEYGEVNLFLRGLIPQIGLKFATVEYERQERRAGTSKYPLKKMLKLGWDGVTSFSAKPLRIMTVLGILASLIGVGMIIYAFCMFLAGKTVAGWPFIICSIWLIAGWMMIGLGIIGEYLGKIYMESKHRPRYLIEEIVKPKTIKKVTK